MQYLISLIFVSQAFIIYFLSWLIVISWGLFYCKWDLSYFLIMMPSLTSFSKDSVSCLVYAGEILSHHTVGRLVFPSSFIKFYRTRWYVINGLCRKLEVVVFLSIIRPFFFLPLQVFPSCISFPLFPLNTKSFYCWNG